MNKVKDLGMNIEKFYDRKFAICRHIIETDKTNGNTYHILNMADFHDLSNLPNNLLIVLKEYLSSRSGSIDFVTITGDIEAGLTLLKKESVIKIRSILKEFSHLLGNIPIYIVPGNHELGVALRYSKEKIFSIFRKMQSNDVIPLINDKTSYKDIDIYGFALGRSFYNRYNVNGMNSILLDNFIKEHSSIDTSKFCLGLIHDCWSVYYSQAINEAAIGNFDMVLSGHSHGGYISTNDLLTIKQNNPYYGYGYVEYFYKKIALLRLPGCYGIHNIFPNTTLSVTEGIRRFNGYLPKSVYTVPFVTEITIDGSKKLEKRLK